MRELTEFEVENLAFLTRYGLDYGLLEPTDTGLGKGIMDATADYRAFLKRNAIHDYETQPQGIVDRETKARIITASGEVVNATTSLYRPVAKQGDPRVWFGKLKRYCQPSDILVSIWADGYIWVLNATHVDFSKAAEGVSAYRDLLKPLVSAREQVFEELLEMLRWLSARGFIRTHKSGSTAVGHLLETELGIKANSRKIPDYKGVELKSTRAKVPRSLTMFAQVANWEISTPKSSREILETFGYPRGGDLNLNCSVSSQGWNSQGLKFRVDEKAGMLHEISNSKTVPMVATWEIQYLQNVLALKHADTFWIKAKSIKSGGEELIHFQTVQQTTQPLVHQFGPMLAAGTIYMDHLISRAAKRNYKVSERGPLFKIKERSFDQMFPEPIFHDLRSVA